MSRTPIDYDKAFAGYCSRRYPDLKALAHDCNVSHSALKKHAVRHQWSQRRSELESKIVCGGDAVTEIVAEVKTGVRPPSDALAARRIATRQKLSDRLDDELAEELEHDVMRLKDARNLPVHIRLPLLATAAKVKEAVLGKHEEPGDHQRSVAILIGFAPGVKATID